MCLIIDANCSAKFASGQPEAAPIAKWLLKRTSRLALGGTSLDREYSKVAKLLPLLSQLDARGQIKRCETEKVDEIEEKLIVAKTLQSDDPHIIALAKVSGARVLYSNDKALHADFCSPKVLDPKGCVYQVPAHAHLLVGAIC